MAGWQSPGARWLRCDLHVHSPFDREKEFGEDIRGAVDAHKKGNPEKLAGIAQRFIEACRSAAGGAGLDLIAITDHNSIEGFRAFKPFFDEMAGHATDEERPTPTILPGVEISVGSERPLHFLIVFASDTKPDEIQRLIGHVFGAHEPFDPNTGTPRATGQSIDDFLHKVYEFCHPSTGDRHLQFVLLPAHTDSNSGVWQEMKGSLRQWTISRIDWNGFQTSKGFDGLPQSFQELIQSWTAAKCGDDWDKLTQSQKARYRARRYWPLIECSDPKNYQEIGSRFTWLKMEVPDIEGIRLALLDPESRLRRMADGTPAERYSRIRSLRIGGTDFFEQIEVPFSCCLTTLIGGRGSGKSTVIEYLRYALDRARTEDLSGEIQDTVREILSKKAERDHGETQGTLLSGYVIEVDLIESDRKYRVSRTENGTKIVRDPDTPQAEGVALDARTLIGPRVLSQRQIARIARDPLAQREELDALIDPDQLRALETLRIQALDRLTALQTVRARLRERRNTLPARETELERVGAQIDYLEKSGGKDILARFASYQREQQWLSEVLAEADRLAESMENQAEAIEHSAEAISGAPTGTENEEWLRTLTGRLQQRFANLACSIRQEAASLRTDIASLREEQQKDWVPKYESASGAYTKLCTELAEHGVEFSQYEKLLQQRALLEREVRELRELEHDVEKTEADIRATRGDMVGLRQKHFALRLNKARTLEQLDADVRLVISAFADQGDFKARREEWFSGTRMQERDWEVLVEFIFSQDEAVPDRLAKLVAALREDINNTKERGRPLERTESEVVSLIGRDLADKLAGYFFRALEKDDRIRLDEMERFLPEDRVEARVKSADGSFKPITSGSVGERSTAILSLLLSAGDQPLIIDQPEDDLDNKYIYEVVVDLLRRRKFSRQIIIATHNANIPVNGDAELIVALGVEDQFGKVLVAGSIDRSEVKEQVSMIMEGSAEAFRLRRERYGF